MRPDAYLTPLLKTEVIPLDSAVEAYKIFGEGSPKKFVIDPAQHDEAGVGGQNK
ncbi:MULTISPECIES: hypothetical protein [Bradyrhizobium]|uniref:hypothetical protein n=1 Tax=Bradyrhizobium TaxID=374 RepID=UPI0012AB9D5F|nr:MULTISPECIES: hypothetical protein [Bradyrhizobium]